MRTKAVALLTIFTFVGLLSVSAEVKYLDCGIDFSCPYFSG